MTTVVATLPTKPLRASPNPHPRLHSRVGPIANAPLLVVGPDAALDGRLVPLASLANRLPVRGGLDLGAARSAGDSAQVAGDFENVLHKAKSPQIGGCVKGWSSSIVFASSSAPVAFFANLCRVFVPVRLFQSNPARRAVTPSEVICPPQGRLGIYSPSTTMCSISPITFQLFPIALLSSSITPMKESLSTRMFLLSTVT